MQQSQYIVNGTTGESMVLACGRVVAWLARRHAKFMQHTSVEDLTQVATLKMLEIVRSMAAGDRPQVRNLHGYLCGVADRAMYDYVKSGHDDLLRRPGLQRSYTKSLDTPVGFDEDETLRDILPDHAPNRRDRDYSVLYARLADLPDEQYRVIAGYFGLPGHGQSSVLEMAAAFGVSETTIRRRLDKAIITLRRVLTVEDLEAMR